MTARSFTLTSSEQQRIDHIDQLVALGAQSVSELVAALSETSWTVRRATVAALAALGDDAIPALRSWLTNQRTSESAIAAAVDAFASSIGSTANAAAIAMLGHDRSAVVADAATILGRRHALEAIAALAELLDHADDNVAVAAIEALGMVGASGIPASAIDPLIAVLEKRSFFRAFPALQVLARSADPRTVQPIASLLADPTFGPEAMRALGRTGLTSAIAPLAPLLAEPSSTAVIALADLVERAEWNGAANHLHLVLAPVLETLIARLRTADPSERAAIIGVLGHGGSPRVVPVVAGFLDDESLRPHALAAIKALTRNHHIALLDTLGDSDAATVAAVLPLVTSRDDAARVRGLLADGDSEVRARACEALARLGDTTAVPALFEALADRNPRVTLAAAGAIQSLQTSETNTLALAALADGTPAVRRQVLRIIAYLGFADAFEPVLAATADPDRRVAELAVGALGTMTDPRVDDALEQLARSPEATVRATTMRAWGHRDSARASAQLERGLADDDAWVRYYACQGLGRLGHTAATSLLLARLADAMPHVRIAAIEALAHFETPEAWQALTSAVRSTDPDECRAALVGLGQRPRPAAVSILVGAARTHDLATRLIAISGLAIQAGPDAIAELERAARDTDLALRDAATSLLADREDADAITALIAVALDAEPADPVHAALSRPSTARAAGIGRALHAADDHAASVLTAALARMGATDVLFETLTTGAPPARRAAASSLVAIGADGARELVAKLAAEDPDPDVRRFCEALA